MATRLPARSPGLSEPRHHALVDDHAQPEVEVAVGPVHALDRGIGNVPGHDEVDRAGPQLVGQLFVVGFDDLDLLRAERFRDHRRQTEIETVFLLAVVDEVQRCRIGLHPDAQNAGLLDAREHAAALPGLGLRLGLAGAVWAAGPGSPEPGSLKGSRSRYIQAAYPRTPTPTRNRSSFPAPVRRISPACDFRDLHRCSLHPTRIRCRLSSARAALAPLSLAMTALAVSRPDWAAPFM